MVHTATASFHGSIVLLAVGFQVVMWLLAKRKKNAAQQAKDPAAQARLKEQARVRMEAEQARRRAQANDGDVNGEDARLAREAASRARKEQAIDVGKDLLGQLARELGLKLPESDAPPRPIPTPRPAPAPAPAEGKPAYGQAAHSTRAKPEAYTAERERPQSLRDLLSAQKAASSTEGENAPRRVPHAKPLEPVSQPAAPMLRAGELSDPESLRRAFILKTILDKPVSQQSRNR